MLKIVVPAGELWDSGSETFSYTKETVLHLEHSLVSISKWESKWQKPFLSRESKTRVELLDYIRCMTITQNVNPYVYLLITAEQIEQIEDYINVERTATKIHHPNGKGSGFQETLTSELIYFWMISYQIPFECQKWHLSRLLALIRVCEVRNSEPKKLNQRELAEQRRALNAKRCAALHSKG